MKALLAINGIRELTIGEMHYAFNDNLLRKQALIEYFSHAEALSDHDNEFFISVIVCNGRRCTNIPFYWQRGQVLQRTVIVCMVAYLVSFIERCSDASVAADLHRLAEAVPESFQYLIPPCAKARAAERSKFRLVRKTIAAHDDLLNQVDL